MGAVSEVALARDLMNVGKALQESRSIANQLHLSHPGRIDENSTLRLRFLFIVEQVTDALEEIGKLARTDVAIHPALVLGDDIDCACTAHDALNGGALAFRLLATMLIFGQFSDSLPASPSA